VADTEVSRGNVLVEATSNDNVEPGGGSAVLMVLILQFNSLGKLGKDVRGSNALGVLGGSHAVGRNLTAQGTKPTPSWARPSLILLEAALWAAKRSSRDWGPSTMALRPAWSA
jgi:hypothetical protein